MVASGFNAQDIQQTRYWSYLRWLGIAFVFKTLALVTLEYGRYFPADFASDFLILHESHFRGAYAVAFYAHIVSAPIALVNFLILLNQTVLKRYRRLHRLLGRINAAVILGVMIPSGLWIAYYSFAGWQASLGFYVSGVGLGLCICQAWRAAVMHRFLSHKRWMWRAFAFMLSAFVLRTMGGITLLFDLPPVPMYRWAAWLSWLVPLLITEWMIRAFSKTARRESFGPQGG